MNPEKDDRRFYARSFTALPDPSAVPEDPPEAEPPWLTEMQIHEALFVARCARNRRIALWFLIPYGIGGGLVGLILGWLAVETDAPHWALLTLGAAFAVIMLSQWGQPYLWNRPVQDSAIRQPEPPEAGSVDDARGSAPS